MVRSILVCLILACVAVKVADAQTAPSSAPRLSPAPDSGWTCERNAYRSVVCPGGREP